MSLFFNVGKSDMKGVCGGEAWMVVFHGYAPSQSSARTGINLPLINAWRLQLCWRMIGWELRDLIIIMNPGQRTVKRVHEPVPNHPA